MAVHLDPVSSIPNLGPASQEGFAAAGIHSAQALRALGPDEAYLAYLCAGHRPHFIFYYAMVMGLQGRAWNDCKGAEKDGLRVRFDAIKARAVAAQKGGAYGKGRTDSAALEAFFNEIGLI
ncbi:TfoX/Sxy family DNA transformation protein [Albirhodobacter sp. R86504]|uniref:TfoX/Sxy family DNA transformation protein n=1 Tax=Albirhodobacter sp. R86504 TaxID=3093848 RepID=UPI00366F368D